MYLNGNLHKLYTIQLILYFQNYQILFNEKCQTYQIPPETGQEREQ